MSCNDPRALRLVSKLYLSYRRHHGGGESHRGECRHGHANWWNNGENTDRNDELFPLKGKP